MQQLVKTWRLNESTRNCRASTGTQRHQWKKGGKEHHVNKTAAQPMGRIFRGAAQQTQTKSSKTLRRFSRQNTTSLDCRKPTKEEVKTPFKFLNGNASGPGRIPAEALKVQRKSLPLVWEDPGRGKSTYRLEGGISCQVTKERRHQQLLQLQRNSTSLRAWKGLQQIHSRKIKGRNGPKTEKPASRLPKVEIVRWSQNVGVITALNYSD